MSAASVQRDGDTLSVSGSIDFDNARSVLERVQPEIRKSASLTIDLGGIERSNSAGLALMIEWLSIARAAGHALTFARVPDGLLQLARVCQVEALVAAPAGG